jgi:pimeloyl-ACP methyl ester carboxylesterase
MAHGRVNAWLSAVAAALAVASVSADGGPSAPAPALRLAPCSFAGTAALCGSVPVPENRSTPAGRVISLRVAVVPAQAERRRPDPVVWLAGGPGVAATDDLLFAVRLLGAVNVERDLVFIDQRGTGGSNRLVCPQGSDATRWADELRSCLAGLAADTAAYTTAWAMDDVDDVRAALGYATVNLYGGSYGATAVQVYVQRHPDRVRSATVIAGTALDIPIFDRFPASSQRALDLVFAGCARDPACRAAYPDPAADLRALAAQLDRAPVDVPVTDPSTGRPAQFTRQMLGPGLHGLLRDRSTAVLIPRILHGASRGDWSDALAVAPPAVPDDGPPSWLLMNLTILCHEPWARLDATETTRAAQRSYLSYDDVRALTVPEGVCAAVPRPAPAAIYADPVPVPVPVLFINGDADPQDPPGNVAPAAGTYPGGLVLTAAGESHQFVDTGCLSEVIGAFIDRPSTRAMSTCLARPPALPFAVD